MSQTNVIRSSLRRPAHWTLPPVVPALAGDKKSISEPEPPNGVTRDWSLGRKTVPLWVLEGGEPAILDRTRKTFTYPYGRLRHRQTFVGLFSGQKYVVPDGIGFTVKYGVHERFIPLPPETLFPDSLAFRYWWKAAKKSYRMEQKALAKVAELSLAKQFPSADIFAEGQKVVLVDGYIAGPRGSLQRVQGALVEGGAIEVGPPVSDAEETVGNVVVSLPAGQQVWMIAGKTRTVSLEQGQQWHKQAIERAQHPVRCFFYDLHDRFSTTERNERGFVGSPSRQSHEQQRPVEPALPTFIPDAQTVAQQLAEALPEPVLALVAPLGVKQLAEQLPELSSQELCQTINALRILKKVHIACTTGKTPSLTRPKAEIIATCCIEVFGQREPAKCRAQVQGCDWPAEVREQLAAAFAAISDHSRVLDFGNDTLGVA